MEPSPEIKAAWDLAIALHGQGRYGEALDCLRALEARLPGNPALLVNLGIAYRDSGDLARAEHYLRRACALRPDDPAVHFNLALTLLGAGRLEEGLLEYEWRWQVEQFREQRREFLQPLVARRAAPWTPHSDLWRAGRGRCDSIRSLCAAGAGGRR